MQGIATRRRCIVSTRLELLLVLLGSALVILMAVAWHISDLRSKKKSEELRRRARYEVFMAGIKKGKDRSA